MTRARIEHHIVWSDRHGKWSHGAVDYPGVLHLKWAKTGFGSTADALAAWQGAPFRGYRLYMYAVESHREIIAGLQASVEYLVQDDLLADVEGGIMDL